MYQSLYRKYRPKRFDDVVGQKVITTTLKNSISHNRVSHAYLFVGPRGVGKTSIAKIFARSVNCTNNDEGDLCGNCSACLISGEKECLDIIEIDAASNNGVDEIRELRDKVNLVPSELKYKVYIIDEVHMLTIQAFNALLKTLEEPPSHVIFVLATTDPQKIPETIVSRCQCFNFSRVSDADIALRLKYICECENISIDDEVLKNIAFTSDGGMRDSIGMLDKLISYKDNNINMEDFIFLNGMLTKDSIESFVSDVITFNSISVINNLESWSNAGINIINILGQVINYLKNYIISMCGKNSFNDDYNIKIDLLTLINEKMFEIRKSSNPLLYLQVILLKFINDRNKNISHEINESNNKNISQEIIENDNKNISREIIENNNKNISQEKIADDVHIANTQDVESLYVNNVVDIRINNTLCDASKLELNSDKQKFTKLNDFVFDDKIGYLACALLDGNIRASSKDYIIISYEYESIVKDNLKNMDSFSKILADNVGINKKIAIITDEKWNEIKKEYIVRLKKGPQYIFMKEDDALPSKLDKNKKKVNNHGILEAFGDIVEEE